jgi:peptidoglycan/LPS O-acetylase OafA/YrhL
LLLPQVKCDIIKKAGSISFEVYLWHVPLYGLLLTVLAIKGRVIQRSYITMILFCVIAWIVAIVIYCGIEKPLTNKIEDSNVTLAAVEIAEGKVGPKC